MIPEFIALGELLIDFFPTISGVTLIEAEIFQKAPGGAPANVAVGVSRLGLSSGFMGKVGDDAFGHFLAQTLRENGTDVSALRYSQEARTALAFVSLKEDGDRDFMFYRHPSADMLYTVAEVDEEYIRSGRIFHFGSISLINEPSRSATLHAIEIAQNAGLLVSYDPNLRLALWPCEEAAQHGMRLGWQYAQIIKASEEEVIFLAGEDDLYLAVRKLWHSRLRLLVVTRGKEGCIYFTREFSGEVPSFKVQSIDTTGAGDGFLAGLLKGILQMSDWEQPQALREICRYANAVGALTTTQRGAIPALPTAAEVESFLQLQS